MSLEEKLVDEMKQAMRSSDKVRLSAIRMIRTAVKNKEIELRKKLDDEEIQRVIQGMLRRNEESIEQFRLGGRRDLVDKESKEGDILRSFLPQALSTEEILKVIDESLQETQASSMKDLGKVMKSVMPKLAGKADGKVINQLVKEKLSP